LLWVDSRRIAANQHNGRYQGVSGRSDQDFRFSESSVCFRAITGRKYHPERELTSGSFRLKRSHSTDKKNPARGGCVFHIQERAMILGNPPIYNCIQK
jgi:hypothetical protein